MATTSSAAVGPLRVARGVLGVAAVVALLYELSVAPTVRGGSILRYLSFFTTWSNALGAGLLLAGAWRPAADARRDELRGASLLFIEITGIVYVIVAIGADDALGDATWWANAIFHIAMPIGLLVDWLVAPPSTRIERRRAQRWLLVPIAYFFYSLARGFFATWYPYPFLDPGKAGGYSGVFITGAIMLAVMSLLAWAVAALGDLRRPRAT